MQNSKPMSAFTSKQTSKLKMNDQAPGLDNGNNNLSVRDESLISSHDLRPRENNGVKQCFVYYIKLLLFISVGAILVSIPWEFILLYQKARAQKLLHIVQGEPSECNRDTVTLLDSFIGLLRYYFSWAHAKTPCLSYYHASMVDPLWEVPPTMVLSSVFVKCFLYPLELISTGLGQCMRLFFSEIPVQWQLMLMLFFALFIFMLLIMLFGYRLSVPFLFRLEPASSAHSPAFTRSNSYPNTVEHFNNSNRLEQLPYNCAVSQRRHLLPSLSTTSIDSLSRHIHPDEAMQSFIESHYTHLEVLPAIPATSSVKRRQLQSVLSYRQKQKVTTREDTCSGKRTGETSMCKQTETVETFLIEGKLDSINGRAKLSGQQKNRKRTVATKIIKDSDPSWTPDSDCPSSSDRIFAEKKLQESRSNLQAASYLLFDVTWKNRPLTLVKCGGLPLGRDF